MLSVLMADRFDINRLGFRSLVERNGHCAAIDEVSNVPDLLNYLSQYDYDLLVIDPAIADGEAETLLRRIKELSPNINTLVLTDISEVTFGLKALQCGVRGYLVKSCSENELSMAVARVGSGKIHVTEALADVVAAAQLSQSSRPLYESLSEREFQIFAMIVCGKTVTSIAKELSLSVKTVSTHKARVLTKLHADSVTEVVKYAISQNLINDCRIRSAVAPRGYRDQPGVS